MELSLSKAQEQAKKDISSNKNIKKLNELFNEHYELWKSFYKKYGKYYRQYEHGEKDMEEPIQSCIRLTRDLLSRLPKNNNEGSLQDLLRRIISNLNDVLSYFKGLNPNGLKKSADETNGLYERIYITLNP